MQPGRDLLGGQALRHQLGDAALGVGEAVGVGDQRSELGRARTRSGVWLIVREVARGRVRYALTERGQELRAVVQVLGEWGARWLELEPHHSDPAYVLFATSRLVDVERAPARGLVVRFELDDRHYWLLVRRPRAEVCTSYPGRPEDLVVRTRSEVLARCHLRHTTFAQAERGGQLEIDGPRPTVRAFLACIRPSPFAVTA